MPQKFVRLFPLDPSEVPPAFLTRGDEHWYRLYDAWDYAFSDYGSMGRLTSKRGGAVGVIRPTAHTYKGLTFPRWRVYSPKGILRLDYGTLANSIDRLEKRIKKREAGPNIDGRWREQYGRTLLDEKKREWIRGFIPQVEEKGGLFMADWFRRCCEHPDRPVAEKDIWRYFILQSRGSLLLGCDPDLKTTTDPETFQSRIMPPMGIVQT